MKLELKVFSCLCTTEVFTINTVIADSDDFGSNVDLGSEFAKDYCCGDMTFIGKPSTVTILDKYSITEEEYRKVIEKLEEGLSFGSCGWCS